MGLNTEIAGANSVPDSTKAASMAPVIPDTDARSQRKTFSAYQHTIYMNGIRGVLPALTTNPSNWEAAAKAVMEPRDFDYAKGGAGAGETVQKNRDAFQKWSIIPRSM